MFEKSEKALLRHRGISLTGYGLVIGLIAVVAIAAIGQIGSNATALFDETSVALHGANGGSDTGGQEQGSTPTPTLSPGVLVPGDDAMEVTRGELTVSCGQWNANRCELPLFRSANGQGPLGDSIWRIYGHTGASASGRQQDACNLFCALATGNNGHDECLRDDSGITTSFFRLTGRSTSEADETLSFDGNIFTLEIQETTNRFHNRVECSAW